MMITSATTQRVVDPYPHPQAGSSHTQSRHISIPQGPQAGGNHAQSRPVSNQQEHKVHRQTVITHSGPVSTPQPIEGPQADNSDDLFPVTVHSNEKLNAVPAVIMVDLETAVAKCISICKKDNVDNPVKILKCAQKLILQGRPLDVNSPEKNSPLMNL